VRSAVALAVLGTLAIVSACRDRSFGEREAAALTGGDPSRGRALARSYGCGTCHTIPGVGGATGTFGPPLAGIALRSYLAGRLSNSPANLIRWIQHPRAVDPQTAMPELGVPDADARDLAAFLETLR
jgi:cytochrome c